MVEVDATLKEISFLSEFELSSSMVPLRTWTSGPMLVQLAASLTAPMITWLDRLTKLLRQLQVCQEMTSLQELLDSKDAVRPSQWMDIATSASACLLWKAWKSKELGLAFKLPFSDSPVEAWSKSRNELEAVVAEMQQTVSNLTLLQALFRSLQHGQTRSKLVALALDNLPSKAHPKLEALALAEIGTLALAEIGNKGGEPNQIIVADVAEEAVAAKPKAAGGGKAKAKTRGKAA